MDNRQLYHVAPNVADSGDWYSEYYPGVSPSGDQMILVSLESMMYAYRFDHEGRYLERLERQRAGYTPPSEAIRHRNRVLRYWKPSTLSAIHVRAHHSAQAIHQ